GRGRRRIDERTVVEDAVAITGSKRDEAGARDHVRDLEVEPLARPARVGQSVEDDLDGADKGRFFKQSWRRRWFYRGRCRAALGATVGPVVLRERAVWTGEKRARREEAYSECRTSGHDEHEGKTGSIKKSFVFPREHAHPVRAQALVATAS